jgi:two-component system chemotaxis response regulator CheY
MARILIADDSFVMRKKLQEILERLGHKVVAEAADGIQAVHIYEKFLPDIVTMDINMPNMDGIAAVKQIIAKYPNASIIMISSLAQKLMVIEAMQNGAKNYIIKPIDEQKLENVIRSIQIKPPVAAENTAPAQKADPDEFIIDNRNGTFVITLKDSFDDSCLMSLRNALQGLTFIKPLNVVFDIQFKVNNNYKLFSEFLEIMNVIKRAEGSIQLVTYLKENIEALSSRAGAYDVRFYEQGQLKI